MVVVVTYTVVVVEKEVRRWLRLEKSDQLVVLVLVEGGGGSNKRQQWWWEMVVRFETKLTSYQVKRLQLSEEKNVLAKNALAGGGLYGCPSRNVEITFSPSRKAVEEYINERTPLTDRELQRDILR
ncbi:Uncharacterized protein Fot_39349 [Forsythia ovata]|uniref:Uncharacterized protein n=1 Tax=Forsythia ovata TaxID=205694 RepID=A0ABD1S747_9LAMI